MTRWQLFKNLFALFVVTFIEFTKDFKRQFQKYNDRKIFNLDKKKKVSIVLRKDLVDLATEKNPNNFPPHPEDMKNYSTYGVNVKENDESITEEDLKAALSKVYSSMKAQEKNNE